VHRLITDVLGKWTVTAKIEVLKLVEEEVMNAGKRFLKKVKRKEVKVVHT